MKRTICECGFPQSDPPHEHSRERERIEIDRRTEEIDFDLYQSLKATRIEPGLPIRRIAANIVQTLETDEIERLICEIKDLQ